MNIAGASNLQFALESLCHAFEDEYGIASNMVVQSSGMLTAQIMEGADYDIFLSANMQFPEFVFENNLALSSPEVFARGSLILWSNRLFSGINTALLTTDSIRHIAIANPETAPYGKAAQEYLHHSGIYDQISNKLVYGSSLSQTNQFIYSGAAEIGFTSKSLMLAKSIPETRWVSLDNSFYSPIEQGLVLLKNGEFHNEAKAFRDFLFSERGREILTNFGYELP